MQARGFGPLKLKTVRDAMIQSGVVRSNINRHVGRIKRMFRWAVENEYLPAEGPVAEFVEAAAKSLKVEETFFALSMLSCLSGAIGNGARIELHSDWQEPCVLWTALVAESGTLKSPSLELVSKPLRRRQARAIENHEEAMVHYQAREMAYKEDVADWKKEGRKTGESRPEPPTRPICKRYYVGDTTVEALALLLKENPKGLLVIRDELSGLFRGFNQYKAGGKGSDVSHYLSFYGARDLLMDRRTADKTTIFVPKAAVSITGGIQPQILRDVLGTEHFGDGLAARFLVDALAGRAAEGQREPTEGKPPGAPATDWQI